MKKGIRKALAVMIMAAMVFSTAGAAFAGETGESRIDNVKKVSFERTKISDCHEVKKPGKKSEIDKNREEIEKILSEKNGNKSLSRSRETETEYVAQLNGEKYTSLQAAVDEAKNGDKITVISDVDDQSVVINPGEGVSVTIDFDEHWMVSGNYEDMIIISSGEVTIMNAIVWNTSDDTTAGKIHTAFFTQNADVTLKNCNVSTYTGSSAGYYIGEGSEAVINDCQFADACFADEETGAKPKDSAGYLVHEDAVLTMNNCDAYMLYGYGVGSYGTANINDSYICAEYEGSAGIVAFENGTVNINDGYYYGDPALLINDVNSSATITKGEFESMYEAYSAIDSPEFEEFGANVTIASGSMSSPSDWKTYGSDAIDVYKKYAAPSSAKAKLSKYNAVSFSWNKVSGAEAYKVYYKKSSSKSYSLLATTTKTSVSKAGLSSGVKYDFKVYPCDTLDKTEFLKYCRSSNSKSASVYTLKKLSAPKVSKKSSSSVTVKWTNISGEAGYQISKSTSKSGTSIVSTYKTTSGTSKVIKAKKGKTYYYKVRAYALDSKGNKVYAPWSSAKSYKIK